MTNENLKLILKKTGLPNTGLAIRWLQLSNLSDMKNTKTITDDDNFINETKY